MFEIPQERAADLPLAGAGLALEQRDAAPGTLATVAVVGLGYVGLPVATRFGRPRRTLRYDLSARKIFRLKQGVDATGEVSPEEFAESRHLEVTADSEAIREADFVIVAVPTPVNAARQPDLG